jgi:hypothetical protein
MYIVVLTEFKEIFWGKTEDKPDADILHLTGARQALYYSADTGGLLGLAAKGPADGSRIGPKVTALVVHRPVNVMASTKDADNVWRKAK